MQSRILYVTERKRKFVVICKIVKFIFHLAKSNSIDNTHSAPRLFSLYLLLYFRNRFRSPSYVYSFTTWMSVNRSVFLSRERTLLESSGSGLFRPTRYGRETGTARFRRGSFFHRASLRMKCLKEREAYSTMKQGLNDNRRQVDSNPDVTDTREWLL